MSGLSHADALRLALALPEAVEGRHGGHPDLRVRGRIFASLPNDGADVVLKLAPEQQALMVAAEPALFAPVAGSWGVKGWTRLTLAACDEATLHGALRSAWRTVAPKGLHGRLPDLSG